MSDDDDDDEEGVVCWIITRTERGRGPAAPDTRSARSERPAGIMGRGSETANTGAVLSVSTRCSHLVSGVVCSHDPNERRRLLVERERLPGPDEETRQKPPGHTGATDSLKPT